MQSGDCMSHAVPRGSARQRWRRGSTVENGRDERGARLTRSCPRVVDEEDERHGPVRLA
jgi:hypothetical protein